jgi:hypothetical protein
VTDKRWAVIDANRNLLSSVHVLPWDGNRPARGHTADKACWCQPTALPSTWPGEDLIWNHHEPSWPGASDPLQ